MNETLRSNKMTKQGFCDIYKKNVKSTYIYIERYNILLSPACNQIFDAYAMFKYDMTTRINMYPLYFVHTKNQVLYQY